MGDEPDYEPTPDRTVAALAAERGVSPEEVALDHMLTSGGRGMLYVPFLNYAEGSLDPRSRHDESPGHACRASPTAARTSA